MIHKIHAPCRCSEHRVYPRRSDSVLRTRRQENTVYFSSLTPPPRKLRSPLLCWPGPHVWGRDLTLWIKTFTGRLFVSQLRLWHTPTHPPARLYTHTRSLSHRSSRPQPILTPTLTKTHTLTHPQSHPDTQTHVTHNQTYKAEYSCWAFNVLNYPLSLSLTLTVVSAMIKHFFTNSTIKSRFKVKLLIFSFCTPGINMGYYCS